MSDKATAILFFLLIGGGFFLITSLISWLTGSKIKSRYGGVEYSNPDTIPAIYKFISTTSKGIYKNIQSKISQDKFKVISSSKNKMELIQELIKLKNDGFITESEFEILKADLFK